MNPDLFVVHLLHLLGVRLGHRVLDAGSGAGRNAAYLVQAGHEVLCLDASRASLLRGSNELAASVAWTQGRIEALPFRDASFDVALCTSVLESVSAEAACATARELGRVLRPGGHLLVVAAAAEGSDESYPSDAPGLAYQARVTTHQQIDAWFGSLEWLELLHLKLEVPSTAPVRAQWTLIARKPWQ